MDSEYSTCHRNFCDMLISADGVSAHVTLLLQFYGAHVFCPRWHAYDLARTVDMDYANTAGLDQVALFCFVLFAFFPTDRSEQSWSQVEQRCCLGSDTCNAFSSRRFEHHRS